MYKIHRESGRIVISDWNDRIVYSADEDAYVVYKSASGGGTEVVKVKSLTDEQLLNALVSAIKLPLEPTR
jgi:hypothetical protein